MTVTTNYLTFYVNKKKIIEKSVQPHWTLVYYLRTKLNLTGTKVGCGVGGCGSCTVVISKYDHSSQSVRHSSVNSCLTLLCTLDGCHILTVEGLGCTHLSTDNLHPIQRTIAENYGSQCKILAKKESKDHCIFFAGGFCTPGMCMSLYDTLANQKQPTLKDIEDSFNGNLCRCTGYRPILHSAKKAFGEKEISKDLIIDFPQELREEYVPKFLSIESENSNSKFYRPLTLSHLFTLRRQYPDSNQIYFIGGNVGEKFDHIHQYPILIHLNQISELQFLGEQAQGLCVGSCVTISRLKYQLERSQNYQQLYKILYEQLEFNASRQIQNQATFGGHILNHSRKYTSDILPILYVCETKLKFIHLINENEFEIDIKDLLTLELNDNLLLMSIFIPFTNQNEYLQSYKQSHRRQYDTGIVTGAFRLKLNETNQQIELFNAAFAGLADGHIFVPNKTLNFIKQNHLSWTKNDIMDNIKNQLLNEIQLDQNSSDGQPEYRRTLIISFLFKFYLHVCNTTQDLFSKQRPISQSEQIFQIPKGTNHVHQPIIHHNAHIHATGEAKYVDDLPSPEHTVHGALVLSSKPYARILSIHTDEAKISAGFVKFYSAKDIPKNGSNKYGEPVKDDEVFASEYVHCVGTVIGLCVADTEEHARQAAKLIRIEYEELKPIILSIDEAIQHESYFGPSGKQEKLLQIGDIEQGFEESDHILEGTFYTGGQEHFYMEPNAFLVQPISEGYYTQLHFYSTTQAASLAQRSIADALGVYSNDVICHVIRVGGGFGGKESRNVIPCIALALAAHDLQRPARLCLTREEDMKLTGHRHPFKIQYKIGFLKTGQWKSFDVQLFANGGCSTDTALVMLERAMLHCDSVYKCDHVRVRGRVCRTNLPANTAMRGFGGPQGLLAAEYVMDQVCSYLKSTFDQSIIRELNFYQANQRTYFNQLIEKKDWHVPIMWKKLKETGQYEQRLKDIDEFNNKNQFRKRGLSLLATKFGIGITSLIFFQQGGALVTIYKDGSVLITHGGIEIGQGLQIKMLQITAEQLNIDPSFIRFHETATDKIPNTTPTAGSISADINGPALINACEQLNKRLAPLREKHPKLAWPKLIELAYTERIQLFAHGFYTVPEKFLKHNFEQSDVNFIYFTQGVAMSEVEIDCLTGDFHILRTDILMDFGKSLNPLIDIGQIEGAFTQGLGFFTLEELIQGDREHPWISEIGSLHNAGPSKYKIPCANDVPLDFRVTLLSEHETSDHAVCYSSKAVGEPPLFLSATVFFAIKNAIAAYRSNKEPFHLNIPASCERIRMACHDQLTDSVVANENNFQPIGSF